MNELAPAYHLLKNQAHHVEHGNVLVDLFPVQKIN